MCRRTAQWPYENPHCVPAEGLRVPPEGHLGFQQQSHACQDPFGRLLFAPQPEGPDVVGAPQLGSVHRALIGVLGFLSVHGDGFGKDDWHR